MNKEKALFINEIIKEIEKMTPSEKLHVVISAENLKPISIDYTYFQAMLLKKWLLIPSTNSKFIF